MGVEIKCARCGKHEGPFKGVKYEIPEEKDLMEPTQIIEKKLCEGCYRDFHKVLVLWLKGVDILTKQQDYIELDQYRSEYGDRIRKEREKAEKERVAIKRGYKPKK